MKELSEKEIKGVKSLHQRHLNLNELLKGHFTVPRVEIVYKSEAMELLDLRYEEKKDRRRFKRWCSDNGVALLSDTGSRKQYLVWEEFQRARFRVIFNYLHAKGVLERQDGYKPQGGYEKKFLNELK